LTAREKGRKQCGSGMVKQDRHEGEVVVGEEDSPRECIVMRLELASRASE